MHYSAWLTGLAAGPVAEQPVTAAPVLAAPPSPVTRPATPTGPPGPSVLPASRPSGPGRRSGAGRHSKRSGPKRHRPALVITTVVVAAVTAVAVTGLLRSGPAQREWRPVFNGHGAVSVTGSGPQSVIRMRPAPALARDASHAALVVSTASYRDFTATMTVQTVRQLRRGPAGSPHPWEVGWVLWHYTSDESFYALTLEPAGWVLSKQDPAYWGGERFLASGRTPGFAVGTPHRVQITQVGNQITVRAGGHLLTRFTDTQRPYLTGVVGLYCENSQTRFSDIHIAPLPTRGQ
ncbi:MAG TPA: hypothetical protein VIX86_17820 [Streptosporangiaceae bacterium]